jgi:hypothetical protein
VNALETADGSRAESYVFCSSDLTGHYRGGGCVIKLEVTRDIPFSVCVCNLKLRDKACYIYCYYDRNIKMSRFHDANELRVRWITAVSLVLVRMTVIQTTL